MFNSALVYELSALRPLVEPLLRQVPHGSPEYVEAVRLLAERPATRNIVLVHAGGYGWLADDIVRAAHSPALRGRVRLLGYVTQEELASLYSQARLLAYPSLFEGFGLPVAEAMAMGHGLLSRSVDTWEVVPSCWSTSAAMTTTPAVRASAMASWIFSIVRSWWALR